MTERHLSYGNEISKEAADIYFLNCLNYNFQIVARMSLLIINLILFFSSQNSLTIRYNVVFVIVNYISILTTEMKHEKHKGGMTNIAPNYLS
jgi:hypothetical protein